TVHLNQQLIQSLFAFIVSTTEAGATMTAHGIDFIDEDDAGRVLFALFEKVAHARSADTDKHLDEVRSGNREKRDIRLTSDSTRQQRLTSSRGAHHQDALGNATAKLLELLRLLEKLDDLLEFFLSLFHSGNVLERNSLLLVVQELRARLAK